MRLIALVTSLLVACGPDVAVTKSRVDNDSDGYTEEVDCNDAHADINPEAEEVCDGVDNDCDGTVDVDAVDATTVWADADGDGHGDPARPEQSCEAKAGFVANQDDCDDTLAAAYPGSPELCDGIDNDCDGAVDEDASDIALWYADADDDGYGDAALVVEACYAPDGYVGDASDCDDADAGRSPALVEVCDDADVDEDCDGASDDADASTDAGSMTTWYRDADLDGYSSGSGPSLTQCEVPAGYGSATGDCDDYDSAVSPAATERCDGADVDEDCDGLTDDADPSTDAASYLVWYIDADSDGYGDASRTVAQCEAPSRYVADATDCDDANVAIHPGATEVCDAADVDEDCDGAADDADPSTDAAGYLTGYRDADSDGYGSAASPLRQCDLPVGYVADATDCDDASASISPAGVEVCDAADIDEDCDGLTDDADPSTDAASYLVWYNDADSDGYGSAASPLRQCDLPVGYVALSTDCDDASASISPAGVEVCDAADVDEDCDGAADDADPSTDAASYLVWYNDADGDGYGSAASPLRQCDLPVGYVALSTDCDDASASISPAEVEVCDAAYVDEDCDGSIDEGCVAGAYAGDYLAEHGATGVTDADALIYGAYPHEYLGQSLVAGLDLDGDGYGNFVLGAPGNVDAGGYYGSIFIYDGFPSGEVDSDTNHVGRILGGPTSTYKLPDQLWSLEDFDSDGNDEIAAAYSFGSNYYVYIYEGENLGATFSFQSASRTYDYVGSYGPASALGDEDSPIGDNEIGIADWYATSAQGTVEIFSYGTSGLTSSATINGEDADDYAGHGLAGSEANDVNGDGFDDIFIGAPGDDTVGVASGAAYVVEGPVVGTFDLSSAPVKIAGTAPADAFGWTVHAPGDIDGDGHADMLVTAPADDDGGNAAGVIFIFEDVNTDGATKDDDASDYEVRVMGDGLEDALGESAPAFADVNGDGELDLLVGSPYWDNGREGSAGAAWLIYGPLAGSYDLGNSADYDARFVGDESSDGCGRAVGLGDLDADGAADILVDCERGDHAGYTDYGVVYFFAGG